MNATRPTIYRKINRFAYLLAIVFLLSGLLLTLVNHPAQASSPAKPTRGSDPVVRTPEGPPPSVPTQPPAHNPDNPGVPGNRVPGRNSQSFNFGGLGAPNNPTPPVRLQLTSGSVEFTQTNYCLDQVTPGWVSATVVVTIPAGETAILQTNWYIVHPNPYPDHPDYNDNHYEQVTVTNGQRVTWEAFWPGAGLQDPADPDYSTIEIHWGAQLLNPDTGGPVGAAASLDAFFNVPCGAAVALIIDHRCAAEGGAIEWTAYNGNDEDVTASYTITGGYSGTVLIPANDTVILETTPLGERDAVLTWQDSEGGTLTVTDHSALDECRAELSLTNRCVSGDFQEWSAYNHSAEAVRFNWTLDEGRMTGSNTVSAGGHVMFVTSPYGTHTVTISWLSFDVERSVSLTSRPEHCSPPDSTPPTIGGGFEVTITPGTPSRVPSLPPPDATGGPAVLPVTGAESNPVSPLALAQGLATYLGLFFLGVALLMTGFAGRLK